MVGWSKPKGPDMKKILVVDGGPRRNMNTAALCDAFGIPEGHDVGFVLLLGEPAVRYPRAVHKTPDRVTVL